MANLSCLIMLMLALITNIGAAPQTKQSQTEIDKLGQKKLQTIEELERRSYNGIIQFTPKTFEDLVSKNPRPYDVVILWNVEGNNCDHCAEAESEYGQVVYSFLNARGSGNKDIQHKEKKVFFGVMYFKADKLYKKTFKDHGFLTVPYLTISEMDLKREGKPETFFKPENKWLIGAQEVNDAQKQIDFINNSLRTDTKISFTFVSIMIKNFIGLIFIFTFYKLIEYLYEFLLKQWVWFSISIIVFVVCTGGLVYSMINDTPLFKFERNEYGSVVVAEYFMRGQRGQWRGEGWLVSFLVTCTGLLWLYLVNLDKLIPDKNNMRIVIYLALFSLWIMQKLLVVAYRKKSEWYNPGFLPPDYYGVGSLMNDQGNNI